jgi:hypothetical protein
MPNEENIRWVSLRVQQRHEAARLAVVQAEEAVAIAKIRLDEANAILERQRTEFIIYGAPRQAAGK